VKYLVTGRNKVNGHAHGETFDWDIDQVTETRLVTGGHIVRAEESDAAAPDNTNGEGEGEPDAVDDVDNGSWA
jgi:hypothetical protein